MLSRVVDQGRHREGVSQVVEPKKFQLDRRPIGDPGRTVFAPLLLLALLAKGRVNCVSVARAAELKATTIEQVREFLRARGSLRAAPQ